MLTNMSEASQALWLAHRAAFYAHVVKTAEALGVAARDNPAP